MSHKVAHLTQGAKLRPEPRLSVYTIWILKYYDINGSNINNNYYCYHHYYIRANLSLLKRADHSIYI